MNNFVSVNLNGRLGNNLFQIAAAYNYSLNHNKNFIGDVSELTTDRKSFLNNFFKKVSFDKIGFNYNIIKEKSFDFNSQKNDYLLLT